jgi:Asp-tRNA(Asn)/Glu-tRNA(Gln) amidotransferase A subunit family amidase
MSKVSLPPLEPGSPTSLVDAVRALRAGTATPVQLVRQCLQRIDALEPELHAWVEVDAERALAEAHYQQTLRPELLAQLPLHGIAVGIKDIIDVAGMRTRCGSALRDEHVATADAPIVTAMRRLGAIVLGKTETTQFACSDPSPARNPWNPAHSPGGSSAGSAVATATGMCFAALGTQTGGSITRPASFCGVASFKGRWGRWPMSGIVPVSKHLDHVGPHARRVADVAYLWSLINSQLPLAHGALRPEQARVIVDDTWLANTSAPRLAVFDSYFGETSEAGAYQAFERSVAALREAGASIETLSLPASFAGMHASHKVIMAVEAAHVHGTDFVCAPETYNPKISELIELGLATNAVDYLKAREHQVRFRHDLGATLRPGGSPLIALTPASVTVAPPMSEISTGDAQFNAVWSLSGLPTVGVPASLSADGLPLSLQLGAHVESFALLQTAAWCERVVEFQGMQ